MLKMVKEEGPGGVPLVIVGLSYGNIDELKKGHPIQLDIDQCAMLGLGQRQLLIYAGVDEVAMTKEIEDAGLIPEGSTDKLRQKFAEYEQAKKQKGEQ